MSGEGFIPSAPACFEHSEPWCAICGLDVAAFTNNRTRACATPETGAERASLGSAPVMVSPVHNDTLALAAGASAGNGVINSPSGAAHA